MNLFWVKKRVTKKDWNSWYSKNNSYCFLKNEGTDCLIGFCIYNEFIPEGCWEADTNDLSKIYAYRKKVNVRPLPVDIYSLGEEVMEPDYNQKPSAEILSKLDEMRKKLSKKLGVKNEQGRL